MKRNFLYTCLIALASLGFVACDSDNDEQEAKVPSGATPTEEFTFGDCEDEAHAEDAMKLEVKGWDGYTTQEFTSIEFFGDGHYLITTPLAHLAPERTVSVAREADGTTAIFKKNGTKHLKTRATDNNGTMDIDNGKYQYGTYTRVNDHTYRLSDNSVIEFLNDMEAGKGQVTYTDRDGFKSNVYVNLATQDKSATPNRSLCRSWRIDSFEMWVYMNGAYMAHGKQWMENGRVYHDFKLSPSANKWGIEKDDFFDPDTEYCHRVIFSPSGTYVCFYMDGDVDVACWEWRDQSNGIMHYWDPYDYEAEDDWSGDVTVRFKGKQMRIYEDYSTTEGIMTAHIVAVNTLTAAN